MLGQIGSASETTTNLIKDNPQLQNTLARLLISDSNGQHKQRLQQERRKPRRLPPVDVKNLEVKTAEEVAPMPSAGKKSRYLIFTNMKTTEKQAIAARLKEYCENKGSQNKAAATLKGVSPATLSQMLNGNWELITEEMWRNVAAQIGYDARQWIIVQTEGYNRMYKLLADAQENALVLAVTGDAGCGKSQAIEYYARHHRDVFALSCSEYWNRKQFLTELLQAMGVEARAARSPR